MESYDRKRFADDLSKTKAAFAKAHNLSADKLTEALHPYKPESYGIYHQEADSATSSDAVDKLLRTVAAWERAHRKKGKKKRQREFLPFQQRGLDWLMKLQRDGQWRVPTGPGGKMVVDAGISALCLAALAAKPARLRSEEEAKALGKGIEWLLSIQKKDGSFSTYLPNYVTCTAVLALTKSQADGVDKALFQAQQFLRRIQNVERAGTLPQDRDYGSIGYGGDERGDLSNTQMAIEALRATGVQTSDPAIEKALLFLQRVQNLQGPQSWKGTRKTEDGRTVNVRAGNDGGAAYYPGNSPFGYNESTDGSLVARSYGSMTYALLKCYILAGLPKNDPRLQAALNWCLANFNLDENPGSKPSAKKNARYQGLYYYYLTLARALSLAEVDAIKDVDWRKALAKKLQEEQQKDGSWVNKKNGRWWEDNPMICTAYALLALSE